MDESNSNSTAMGKAFDTAKNDDSFYLPPEVFENKDFQRMKASSLAGRQVGPDDHFPRGDPATPEGIARVEPIEIAAEEALKGTPLENAKI